MNQTIGDRRLMRPNKERKAPNCALSDLLFIECRDAPGSRLGDDPDALENGEHLGQYRDVVGHHEGRVGLGQGLQVRGQRVDERIERLERHRFAVVAPSRHDGQALVLAERAEEVFGKGRLAFTRAAENEDRLGITLATQGAVDIPERRKLVLPAHEMGTAATGGGHRGRPKVGGDRLGDLEGVRALPRVAGQKLEAESGQILGNGLVLRERRGIKSLLVLEHLPERAIERTGAGKGLVEHDADGVPVAGRSHDSRSRLLGSHVGRRAGNLVSALRRAGLIELDHQAKIQQDDVAVVRHHHVGGLQIAMDDVVAVQGHHPHDKLGEGRAQPR